MPDYARMDSGGRPFGGVFSLLGLTLKDTVPCRQCPKAAISSTLTLQGSELVPVV